MNPFIDEAIRQCHLCVQACESCTVACLREAGAARMVPCIRVSLDCASICGTLAGLLARDSRFAADATALCISVCQECADICSLYEHEHCQICANDCRQCVAACQASKK